MALTNAEKQRRWREKRNELADDWRQPPLEFVDAILRNLGADKAREVAKLLDEKLRNPKTDCAACSVPAGPQAPGLTTELTVKLTEEDLARFGMVFRALREVVAGGPVGYVTQATHAT